MYVADLGGKLKLSYREFEAAANRHPVRCGPACLITAAGTRIAALWEIVDAAALVAVAMHNPRDPTHFGEWPHAADWQPIAAQQRELPTLSASRMEVLASTLPPAVLYPWR
jgi:hypothetical protein